ncbi:hypothetical protein K493DRAFT_407947 [Basidiobolus meristosporus CBS 931.73]|uniref:Uncharacterized protein n=1 Tax=Basidiobolus meristosporus CBS 931.73 TaxID=1314790 RepID=A0A1Y1YA07_9FUNG|nr:hypothetical protein K493DRAFT_407947 [Basidiobolus meristosporus CBS 931.73]|eukprot:ORX94586.1 hypothetical protein K493DRAFT_407947 [Basidiobolus meristosporus CBS 931.73]
MSGRPNSHEMPGNSYTNKRERFTNELDLEEFAQEWSSGCATPVSITNSWVQISSREMSSASEGEEEEIEEEVEDNQNRRRIHIGLEETLLKASLHSLLATTSTPRVQKKSKKRRNHGTPLSTSVATSLPQSSHITGSPPLRPLPSSHPHSPPTGRIHNMLLNNESDAFRHPIERTASRTSLCMDENIPQAVLLDEREFEEAISYNIIDSGHTHRPMERDSGLPRVQITKPGSPPALSLNWNRARSLTPPPLSVDTIPSTGSIDSNAERPLRRRRREISPPKHKSKNRQSGKKQAEEKAEYKHKRNDEITIQLWMAALVSVALFGTGFSIGFGTGYYMRYTRFYATS